MTARYRRVASPPRPSLGSSSGPTRSQPPEPPAPSLPDFVWQVDPDSGVMVRQERGGGWLARQRDSPRPQAWGSSKERALARLNELVQEQQS